MIKKFFLPTANVGTTTMLAKFGYLETANENEADFFVFTGGSDVSASLYGKSNHPSMKWMSPERDLRELYYVGKARLLGRWCIGICRGFQFLNAAAGVQLQQHIQGHEHLDHSISYTYKMEKVATVNSSHHQAVPRSAADELDYSQFMVSVSLEAENKKLEHLEGGVCPSFKFLGVQYHPEWDGCPKPAIELYKKMIEENV